MVDTSATLFKKLAEIGLDSKEAIVYVSIAELGQSTASRIARHTKLKRTTVYNLIPPLLDKGLIEKSLIKNISYFGISNIKNLSEHIEQKVQIAKQIEQELIKIKSATPIKSKISTFEGVDGLKKVYADIMESSPKGSVLYAFFHVENNAKHPPKKVLEIETANRVKKGIRLRLITDQKTIENYSWRSDGTELREIKYIGPTYNLPINGETIVTPTKIIHISYVDDFLCTIIENRDVVEMQKLLFEQLWEKI